MDRSNQGKDRCERSLSIVNWTTRLVGRIRRADASFPKGDIFDQVAPAIEDTGLDCECLGGGRINHENGKKKIEIFGYSQGFGQANHSITARILSKKYRDYDNITWNNEGY